MKENIDNGNDDCVFENISNYISGRSQSIIRPIFSIKLV